MDVVVAILGLLAVAMAAITAGLIRWAFQARQATSAAVVLFLLVMMVAMLGGALVYYLHPSTSSLVAGLWLASAAMSLSVLPVFWVFLHDAHRRLELGDAYEPTPLRHRQGFALAVLLVVLVNEVLMGWTFQLASSGPAAPPLGEWGAALAYGVNSPWFLLPMALEMGLSGYLLRDSLSRSVLGVFELQAGMMAFAPPLSTNDLWVGLSVIVGSALMFGVYAFPMADIYRRRSFPRALSVYLMVLLPVFGAMLAGVVLWVVKGAGWLFAVSVLAQMALYFDAVILSDLFRQDPGRAVKST